MYTWPNFKTMWMFPNFCSSLFYLYLVSDKLSIPNSLLTFASTCIQAILYSIQVSLFIMFHLIFLKWLTIRFNTLNFIHFEIMEWKYLRCMTFLSVLKSKLFTLIIYFVLIPLLVTIVLVVAMSKKF